MKINLILLISCLPVILMCAYVYSKDLDKEPSKIINKLFVYGIFSIVPIVLLELLTDHFIFIDKRNLISLFINTFVTVGFIEEGTKWIIVNKASYHDIEFNHAYDAIIYCVFASLGFALIENILYVLTQGLLVGILRAITTIPAHTFNGVIMGYYLGLSKNEDINKNYKESKKYIFLSLFMPIIAHTFYDFLLFSEKTITTIIFVIFVVFMYVISFTIIKNISLIKRNFDGSNYDSKERIKYESNNELFKYALLNVFIITVILILISSIFMIFNVKI